MALGLLLTPGVFAQRAPWIDEGVAEHAFLTLSDGLTDSTIFSIDQDELGRLWFGTASGGANVFDGHTVKALIHDESPDSLSHSDAGQVFVHSDGTVYVGTWGAGLNRLVAPEGRFERINPQSAPLRIQTLFEDATGRLWVGASGDGLQLFDGASSFSPVLLAEGSALDRVWSLAQGPEGRLWVAADGGLYEVTRDLTVEPVELALSEEPRALATSEGRLWIGGETALYSLSLVTGELRRVASDLPVINVLETAPDGRLVVGTLAGLYAIDPATNDLVSPIGDHRLRLFPDRNIRDIDYDRTGMMWLATREAGVIRLLSQQTGFGGHSTHEQLETVDTLVELSPDELLIGSRRGLWRLHRTQGGPSLESVGESSSLFVNQIVQGPETPRGREIYVGTRSGLRLYDADSQTLRTDPRHAFLDGVSVTVIFPSPDGSLWVGTWAQGLFHLPKDGAEPVRYWTGGDPALPDDFLSFVVPDAERGLWLGHWYEGLSYLDLQTGELEVFTSQPQAPGALPLGHLHSAVLQDGTLYVGTSFGFGRLDRAGGRAERLDIAEDGLPLSVQRLEGDERGNLWIATTRGIKRLDPATGDLVHYGKADGLVATEFYARSGARGANGRLYFGGVGGLVSFRPERVVDRFEEPEVFIAGALIDGRPVPLSGEALVVAPGTRELRFQFLAADYKDPEENRYQVRLLGETDEWSEPSGENQASFAALRPDAYRFQVRAANSNGVWSAESSTVEIEVQPFWWQTWSGRLLLFGGILLAVYAWHRFRTASIHAANRRLEAEVARQTRDLQQANDQLEAAASTDFLTGLPNRRGFYAELSERQEEAGVFAIADVDNFKAFNDRFGHEAGDVVLKNIAVVLASIVRPQDFVARWGGEEFVFFFGEIGLDEAATIADRVRRAIEEATIASPFTDQPLSITVGVAERRRGESVDRSVDRADQVLFAGKQDGKNRVVRAS
ncbi:MAG: diguanylate cyclase [Acidobacteriota bacterium]